MVRIALHQGLISEVVGVLLESDSDVECLLVTDRFGQSDKRSSNGWSK